MHLFAIFIFALCILMQPSSLNSASLGKNTAGRRVSLSKSSPSRRNSTNTKITRSERTKSYLFEEIAKENRKGRRVQSDHDKMAVTTPHRKSVAEKILSGSSQLAAQALRLTTSTLKTSVDMLAGKHVSLEQIAGQWRMIQEIEAKNGLTYAYPVRIKIAEDGSLTTLLNDQQFHADFSFRERTWPRYCTIQFEAVASVDPSLGQPVKLIYRGYFKKNLFNSQDISLHGHVYRQSGRLFWKGVQRCGQFTAIRENDVTSERKRSR